MNKLNAIMYFISFLHTINIFPDCGKTGFFVHNCILLIHLNVLNNFL